MIRVEAQTIRVPDVTSTIVAEIAENPSSGKFERYFKFLDADGAVVLTVMVEGATQEAVEVTIPEHAF